MLRESKVITKLYQLFLLAQSRPSKKTNFKIKCFVFGVVVFFETIPLWTSFGRAPPFFGRASRFRPIFG